MSDAPHQKDAAERMNEAGGDPAEREQNIGGDRERSVFGEIGVHADRSRQRLVAAIANADAGDAPTPDDENGEADEPSASTSAA